MEDLANHHGLLRPLLGVAPEWGGSDRKFNHRTLSDNVAIFDEELLQKINAIVVAHGREHFIRSASDQPMRIKADSYVLETDVHYPTDVNLLWDAMRKCLDYVVPLCQTHGLGGWRKADDWRARLKNEMRSIRRTNQLAFRAHGTVDCSMARSFRGRLRRVCPAPCAQFPISVQEVRRESYMFLWPLYLSAGLKLPKNGGLKMGILPVLVVVQIR